MLDTQPRNGGPLPGAVVDSRRRIRLCLAGFALLLVGVFGRAVQLEVTQGDAFRSEAARPLVRRHSVPGVRGRILARNGTVLACDKEVLALAVHYRWLEEPPNPRWLRWTARSRLSRAERKDPRRVAAEEARLRAERDEIAGRLAKLSGLAREEWNRRARRIQTRVERIAESVNRRRAVKEASEAPPSPSQGMSPDDRAATGPFSFASLGQFLLDVLRASMDEPPHRITVAEEVDYHVMVEDVPLGLVAEVEANPERYPCVRIVLRPRRVYPSGRLAAHVLGHLGPVGKEELAEGDGPDAYHPEDRVGRMGLELQYEHLLRGRRGLAEERTDRSGRILSRCRLREPEVGRDLVLTLDPALQRAAEDLLAGALRRRAILVADAEPAGGAIVVMDVRTGELLAAASGPSFDPNGFEEKVEEKGVRTLFPGRAGGRFTEKASREKSSDPFSDPAHPLFDRVVKMAIPPGSVFKAVAAAALLESEAVDPQDRFFCRGYLDQPERWRCAIYTRHGVGHGEVTLADALAESCNVYFFHHVGRLGPEPLAEWASAFGFGAPTGVDLPDEAAGTLPTPAGIRALKGHAWRTGDTKLTAIGQGALEATPLQVVRMKAAVANGGRLVTPHVVRALGLAAHDDGPASTPLDDSADDPVRVPPPRPIPGLSGPTLAVIREGLQRVVADPRGTAHATVHLEAIPIAGKTGTAETGPGRAAHAWFAGYVPADRPRLAFVVVLEHAGDAAQAAGPVARRLVRQMQRQGYLGVPRRAHELTAASHQVPLAAEDHVDAQ